MSRKQSDRAPWHRIHKALADPLRIRIIEALWEAPRSARELATVIELPADRLYYHLKHLEEASLIEVVEYRRLARGKVERVYAPVQVEPPGDTADPGERAGFLGSVLEATRADITAAYRAERDGGRRRVELYRGALRLTEDALDELRSQIERLVEAYGETGDPSGDVTAPGAQTAVWTRLLVATVDLQNRPPATSEGGSS